MATFDVLEQGMRLVRITIGDETVRAESDALSHLRGAVEVDAPVPSLGHAIRSILSDEAELGGDIDRARALAAKERAEELLRREHDAEAVSALARAHARVRASGGLTGVGTSTH